MTEDEKKIQLTGCFAQINQSFHRRLMATIRCTIENELIELRPRLKHIESEINKICDSYKQNLKHFTIDRTNEKNDVSVLVNNIETVLGKIDAKKYTDGLALYYKLETRNDQLESSLNFANAFFAKYFNSLNEQAQAAASSNQVLTP